MKSPTRPIIRYHGGKWRRGLEIHGFEVKIDRRDWIKELKNPEKAEAVFKYCDRWWVVATENVVKPGELPPTWGLLSWTPTETVVSAIKFALSADLFCTYNGIKGMRNQAQKLIETIDSALKEVKQST